MPSPTDLKLEYVSLIGANSGTIKAYAEVGSSGYEVLDLTLKHHLNGDKVTKFSVATKAINEKNVG